MLGPGKKVLNVITIDQNLYTNKILESLYKQDTSNKKGTVVDNFSQSQLSPI